MAEFQWIRGWESQIIGSDNHYYMNDFDDSTLEEVISTLIEMVSWAENRYKIKFNDITIMGGDKDRSYRCISFTELNFSQLVECIAICEHIDPVWLRWVILRRKATIRYSDKVNRGNVKVVYTIKGDNAELPEKVSESIFETMV